MIEKLFPKKSQWNKWSLPSKLTAIGTYIGLISLIITIFTLSTSPNENSNIEIPKPRPLFNILKEIKLGYSIRKAEEILDVPTKEYEGIKEFETADSYIRIGYGEYKGLEFGKNEIHTIELIPTNIETSKNFVFAKGTQENIHLFSSTVDDIFNSNISRIEASLGGNSVCSQYWRVVYDSTCNACGDTIAVGGYMECPLYLSNIRNNKQSDWQSNSKLEGVVFGLAGGWYEALDDKQNVGLSLEDHYLLVKDEIPQYFIISKIHSEELPF